MSDKVRRWRCLDCQKIFLDTYSLIGPHPFRSGSVTGCPHCREIVDFATLVCDQEDCGEEATCGWPSPAGYRNTCSAHSRR